MPLSEAESQRHLNAARVVPLRVDGAGLHIALRADGCGELDPAKGVEELAAQLQRLALSNREVPGTASGRRSWCRDCGRLAGPENYFRTLMGQAV